MGRAWPARGKPLRCALCDTLKERPERAGGKSTGVAKAPDLFPPIREGVLSSA